MKNSLPISDATLGKKIILNFVIGILVVLIFIGVFVAYKTLNNPQAPENIKISTSKENAEKLKSQLVYNIGEEGLVSFYSKSLDAVFTYPKEKFGLSDMGDSVILDPKTQSRFSSVGFNSVFFYKEEVKIVGTSVDEYLINEYKAAKHIVSSELVDSKVDEGLIKIKFRTSETSIFTDTVQKKINLFIVKKIDDNYIVARITYLEGFENPQLENDIQKLLNEGIKIGSEGIEKDIKVVIEPYGSTTGMALSVSYDRTKWSGSSENNNYLSIDYYLPKEGTTNLRIKFPPEPDPSADKAKSLAQEDESYSKTGLYSDTYKLLTDAEPVDFLGTTFYKSVSRFNFLDDPKEIGYNVTYYGYLDDLKSYLEINIGVYDLNSQGLKEAETVARSIKTQLIPRNASANFADMRSRVLGTKTDETSDVEIDKPSILGQNSIVHIFNNSCVETTIVNMPELSDFNGKKYNVCQAGEGTGFFINGNGYLITNSHVANPSPEDIVYSDIKNYDSKFWNDYVTGIVGNFENRDEFDATYQSEQDFLIALIERFISDIDHGNIKLTKNYENYLEGKNPFEFDYELMDLKNKDQHIQAKFVDGTIDSTLRISYDVIQQWKAGKNDEDIVAGINTPDIAVLRVEKNSEINNFPGLILENPTLINVGQNILAIGFPGVADNRTLFSKDASTIPTITKGTISAVKPSVGGTFNLIQIDASINRGNSGGPVLNGKGKVIGISTYLVNPEGSGGNFNAAVSVESIHQILEKNGIDNQVGKASIFLQDGLNNFLKTYYSLAVTDLTKSKELYNSKYDLITPLIGISEEKISLGEDNSPLIVIGSVELKKNDVIIIIGVSSIVILIVLILLIILIIHSHKKINKTVNRIEQNQMPPVSNQPVYQQNIPQNIYPTQPQQPQNPETPQQVVQNPWGTQQQ